MNINPFVKGLAIAAPVAVGGSLLLNNAYGGNAGRDAGFTAGALALGICAAAVFPDMLVYGRLDAFIPTRAIGGVGVGILAGVLAADIGTSLLNKKS